MTLTNYFTTNVNSKPLKICNNMLFFTISHKLFTLLNRRINLILKFSVANANIFKKILLILS